MTQKSILLVDDNPAVRCSLHGLFERAGWEIAGECENGRDAITVAQQTHPNLILLDLSMPEMDGLAAGKILKDILPNIPLILFSLSGHLVPAVQLSNSGIAVAVSKGSSEKELMHTAEELLKRSAA